MGVRIGGALGAVALLLVSLTACSGSDQAPIGGDIVAPVTLSVNELQGETVELVVGQALNINTDSLAVDSYTGTVSNPEVAKFSAGKKDATAEFNPGVTALAPGVAEVTMTNAQGGIQPLVFTVEVTERQ